MSLASSGGDASQQGNSTGEPYMLLDFDRDGLSSCLAYFVMLRRDAYTLHVKQ